MAKIQLVTSAMEASYGSNEPKGRMVVRGRFTFKNENGFSVERRLLLRRGYQGETLPLAQETMRKLRENNPGLEMRGYLSIEL